MFKKSLSYILPSQITVILGVEDQTYCCGLPGVDLSFSLMKCWRSSTLIEESALESSASLYPLAESFSMKKPFFLTNVSGLLLLLLFFFFFIYLLACLLGCLFVCLFIEDDFILKETVEDGFRMALRPACTKIVQSLSSLCDIWCPGFCFIKSFPFVNTPCIEEQNTQGPTPSNRRQDHEDHSTY